MAPLATGFGFTGGAVRRHSPAVPAPRRPRVLLVDHVSKVMGGAEMNVVDLLGHPAARVAWDVTVACAPDGPLARAMAAQGWPLRGHAFGAALNELRVVGRRFDPMAKFRGWRELQHATNRLKALVSEVRPDVLLSCTNKDHFAAGAAGQALGIRTLWWVNDILSADFFGWPVRKVFAARARRHAPTLAAVSEFGRNALIREGIPAGSIRTVHNGISPERYRRDATRPLRRELGIAEGEPLYGVVGRLTAWKGQDVFLRVAKAWAREGKPGKFVVIGGAFNEDESFAAHLKEYVRLHGLGERVRFVPFLPDVVGALSSLDVLLHTSTKPEPFGRVLIEAMAVGVPVIASREGGVPEIVTHDHDGGLVAPGDVAGYVALLAGLAGDPARWERWRDAGLETVRRRFTLDRVFRDWDGLIRAGWETDG